MRDEKPTLQMLEPLPLAPEIRSGGGLRAGLVFFPCHTCQAVVDLTRVNDPERPPLCDRHRSDLLISA